MDVSDYDIALEHLEAHHSQSHFCVCNDSLFDDSVNDGIYGFPYAGESTKKTSFWRSISGLACIKPNDLIFIYRMNGKNSGCKELHGPFVAYTSSGDRAATMVDSNSSKKIVLPSGAECRARLLFSPLCDKMYSIDEPFELIKAYENKSIWGYRHPAVMNIGAARKKSITTFTHKQTLDLLKIFKSHSVSRKLFKSKSTIPSKGCVKLFNGLSKSTTSKKAIVDDSYISDNYVNLESWMYAYILNAFVNKNSTFNNKFLADFDEICKPILSTLNTKFSDLFTDVMLETIISPHLQDEIDILFLSSNNEEMLVLEVKKDQISQSDVYQTEKYLDLLDAIFPTREIFGLVLGLSNPSVSSANPRVLLSAYNIINTPNFCVEFK